MEFQDITKIGTRGLKGLKGLEFNPDDTEAQVQAKIAERRRRLMEAPPTPSSTTTRFSAPAYEAIGNRLVDSGFGESTYDAGAYLSELDDLNEHRAQEQPWYSKLGAGIAKGVALAGTTFLDGTMGLIVGIGTAIGEGRISGIWDNEVSNSLSELNRELETVLPNYMTKEEQENPWYKNLGTMNFWADSIIKNLGFTVGAFYSGGAWTKALKGIGWLKGAMGAKVVGSTLSAVNEGRIEANNNSYDFLELQNKEIDDMVERRREEILASDDTEAHKKANLMLLDESANRLREDAKERADAMGLTTLIGNTILLSLDNYAQFGKLYARGFKNARGLSSGISKAAEEMAAEEVGKNVIKQGGKYAWKDITKKQALMKGLKNGLLEGNEEMAQAFIAETAGNMQSPDSPDAYYKALTDQNAQLKTKDFLTSITEGFVNTYGNGDRWEEFAVGAFTGLLGMPTFGKVNNSDANTYLGRGRSIGLSGGLFGEIRNANQQNREGREAVDVMNKYVDKMQNHARYFAQSQSFTDAMDGWAETDDAFEYKNAENNDDFAAISRFAQTGKLNDLKEMVSQSFENLSDDELANIAMHTSPNVKMGEDGTVETSNDDGSPATGGWRNTDGSLMSDTEEGRAQMREELIKKRDKILSEIDKYEKSVETARAIGNNSLTEDQVNELAWLNWKVGMFTDRYNSIKAENEEVLTDIQNSIQAFQRGRGRGMIDEESDEGKKLIKAMENTEEFIDALRSAKTPLQLGALVEANPHLTDFLEDWAYPILEDITGIDAATFEKAMTDLRDTTRIAKATRTFNQRYKEFKEDPIKLIKNRERIDKKKEKVNKASEDVNLKDKVNNSNVSDIVHGMENGDLDSSQLDGLFADEDTEFLNQNVGQEGQPQQPTGKQKVEEAKKIIKTSQRMNDALDNLGDSSIDPQAVADARTLLKNSKDVSESEQEMLDTASQAYNDPAILYDEDDPSMQGISHEELESALNDRIDAAKSVIEQAKAVLSEQNDELDDLPEGASVKQRMGREEVQPKTREDRTTGHDETDKTPTENERQKEAKAKEAQNRKVEEEQTKINDFFSDLKDEVPQGQVATFNKAVGEVLKGIDMLIKAKATPKQIESTIKSTQSYQTAKQLAPSLDDYLNVYVTSKLKPKAEVTQAPSQEAKVSTPTVTEEEVKQATTAQMTVDPNQGEFTGTYQYWKPTLSYLPFGKAYQKGNTTPFYKLARTLTNGNGTPMYTEVQLRRIEAVGKYLDEHGAFKLVDSGGVKVGDKVHFSIDSTLNDEAGELVILMTDDQGRVIGDVMSSTDPRFANQLGLPQLVERIAAEYKKEGSPQHFTSKEVTTVDTNKVGKIPFLADHEVMHTLNEVFVDGEQKVPFKIGVAANSGKNARILASAGRTKRQGQSELERSINPPLSAKAGQPFLLVPTSSAVNHYMTAPFVMESYNPNTQNTALGRAIHKVLERIPASDNSNAMSIINALEELISVQEIHINYDGDNVKITIKPNGAEHQMTIYNGTKSAPNIVEQLELGLQGQPFQVSRKYMNEDYEGQDYNRMIGEVARINLPIGATHTISDWFTIKPIGADGKSMKAKSPRSTGRNPYAAEVPEVVIQRGNMQLFVDPKTWTVSDGKKTYTGSNANKVKAQAFGIYTNQNMEKPYQTAWGYYDPKTDEFVEKPNRVLRTLREPQQNITEDAKKLYDRVSKTHPWLIDLMNVTKEFLESSTTRKETRESLMSRFKKRAMDEGESIIPDDDLATLIDYILGSVVGTPTTQSIQESGTPEVVAAKQQSTEWKITTTATSKSGKVVNGAYSVNTDADGFTHIKRDGGPATAQRRVRPSDMESIGITEEDVLSKKEDYNTPENYDALKKVYDEEGFKIEDITIRPDGTVAVNHNESYFELQGEKAQKFLDKVFPELGAKDAAGTKEEEAVSKPIDVLVGWAEGRISREDAIKQLDGTDYVKHTKGSPGLGTKDGVHLSNKVEWELGKYITEKYPFLFYGNVSVATGVSTFGGNMNLTVVKDAEGNEYGTPSNFLRSLATNPNGRAAEAVKKLSSSQTGTQPIETPAQLEDKAKKAGLLGNKVRQALWQILSPEQQSTIANKKGPKQKQWMDALEGAFNASTNTFDEARLKGTVDVFLGRKALYGRTDEYQEPYKLWNKERELSWLRKALPNLSTSDHLTLIDGLIRINDSSEPGFAYGKFQEGMITISNLAARGTSYHEAFHAVVHTLLNTDEYRKLFNAASERWKGTTDTIKLEEELAEDFRRFMQSEEEWYDNLESKNYSTIRKTLAVLFHKLKNLINELSGKTPYINKLYYSINRGKFARRKAGQTGVTRFSMAKGFRGTIQEFQSIIDNLINNQSWSNKVSKNKELGRVLDYWETEGYKVNVKSRQNPYTKTKRLTVISVERIIPEEPTLYRRIEQYHADKMMYNNLSQDDKDYLTERGITPTEYSQMTQLEKEVLFHCKY